jgi:biotin carboxyl carrier protein
MSKKFKVLLNKDREFEFTPEEAEELDVLEMFPGDFHVLKEHRSHKARLIKADFSAKSYRVKVNSNLYEIDISGELQMLIEKMGLSVIAGAIINDIKAPMPGLILDVQVKEGDEVKEGDYLLVLEAMKMENTITAPRDAVVKSVTVKKGQTVEKNQLLIEME